MNSGDVVVGYLDRRRTEFGGVEAGPGLIVVAPRVSWVAIRDGAPEGEIGLASHAGRHAVVEGGTRRLGRLVEQARATRAGGRDRFRLLVARYGQYVWLGSSGSGDVWRSAGR
ncbi:hypothetical protein Ae168Ps1_1987c [Pseudonocardia sp. Ae168_Ps1]|uniref:hypothetical protein n=1 Tax=unclassified Pseudonocardia TaxID=2619320 RepID=UPI000960E138|nr:MULTISPECIES: hypothetical protein [unclassified Pseudonocardia]OLL79581.1 hypothetical protein Ae168Ps1_1987c [Pseudonocardia sp. Ae168_Ps1]OLL86277.1 hypothetical protein Ae263Ps1_3332 [Pseudonocardia sp. Ae263_Ps1]OLL93680.1 hypothetical protein Ae356Ps1_3577c [Pseudonocardia sp. Ae356_Ps1]